MDIKLCKINKMNEILEEKLKKTKIVILTLILAKKITNISFTTLKLIVSINTESKCFYKLLEYKVQIFFLI